MTKLYLLYLKFGQKVSMTGRWWGNFTNSPFLIKYPRCYNTTHLVNLSKQLVFLKNNLIIFT